MDNPTNGSLEAIELTPGQQRAIDDLLSKLDDLEFTRDGHSNDLIFSGESADGPTAGMIDPDGKVLWLT